MKNLNKRVIFYLLLSISFIINSYCSAGSSNPGLGLGETIPNPEISPIFKNQTEQMKPQRLQDLKEGKVLLIAFMPSVSQNYSDVMSAAFDTYFAQGLSFRSFQEYAFSNPDLQVLVVTPDDPSIIQNYINSKDLDFMMVSDKQLNVENLFGISKWDADNSNIGSQVYMVDKDNKVVYANYDYKGEGEKLKNVQSELYAQFNLKEEMQTSTVYSPLVTGDKARDFDFKYVSFGTNAGATPDVKDGALSDYTGRKNVLIAFYPAAYSYSCSAEISVFNHYAEDRMLEKVSASELNNDDLEILMVSVSNPYILAKWKNDMNLQNVKLLSDDNGAISAMYNSYSTFGYNKRTIFLIDKERNVSYINWDYKVDDNGFAELKDKVLALK